MSLAGKTILLVDDEAYVTQAVSYNLQKAGATVLIRRNGAEMCEAVQNQPPDLIITDYEMPLLNGFEASKKLKTNPATAQIPILLLTARGHRLPASELAQTNIQCLFNKPFSAKQLVAKVESLLTSDTSTQRKSA